MITRLLLPLLCLLELTQLIAGEPQKGNRVVPLSAKARSTSGAPKGSCNSWRPGDCDAALCGGFCEARFMRSTSILRNHYLTYYFYIFVHLELIHANTYSKLNYLMDRIVRTSEFGIEVIHSFCDLRKRFYDRELEGDRSLKSCSCFKDRLCSVIGATGCRSYATLNSFAQRLVRQWSSEGARLGLTYKEDKKRHMQLIFGNSLFCCHSSTPRPRALALRRSDSAHVRLPYPLLIIVAGMWRIL
ncbi:hypothetical protein PRIPAC_92892 [Pristionchus pacificus]|uniref:Uncharacterized protein n=1 Tax=Pristionchus pacificus TaxID=54126 RepID=A0A2A6BRL4_PRIPA|nr:hypothetical protein PRIPAC_92892 [Pristionchus pacificus]|eukprot:PDM68391.1 hypothetical protein PRIPAC_46435 [Pristionchus pacificus]